MYHDSDNIVVSESGRFGVETACGTAEIDIGIGRLQNVEWYEASANSTIGLLNAYSFNMSIAIGRGNR